MNYYKLILFLWFVTVLQIMGQHEDHFNEKWIVVNRTNFYRCLRYCIDDFESQAEYLNILWSDNQFLDQGSVPAIGKALESTCDTSIKIDCNNSFSDLPTKLESMTRKYEFVNELKFKVNSETELLQFTITGNISWVMLQIPLGGRKRSTETLLSLKKNIQTSENYFLIKNPPPGELKLKINEEDLDPWNNITMLVINKSTSLSRIDLPSRIDSREDDSSSKINQEIYEVDEVLVSGSKNIERMDLTQLENENELTKKDVIVDIAYETKLVVIPGFIYTIWFSVTNNVNFDVLYQFDARSSQYQIIRGVEPSWSRAGQTLTIPIQIAVPRNANEFYVNTVNLSVKGTNFREISKSAYIYIQNSTGEIVNSKEPEIEVYFNDNCFGKLSRDRCSLSQWSAEILVKNDQSGVKNVISEPAGIQPLTSFIAGTKSPVYFYYSSTCCNKLVTLRVIDINQNSFTKTVDVTAWDNLTIGEIIAAVVGTILILVILIIIVIVCVNCVKKRKNADLTYTQRYGSRPTP
ncbi:uncharacterized protein LOC141528480 [Cotesia typhae]|uniref:uncharacterized protein LOC141528480 n=1 Tax=Cotesia typhae TaxID=2053667 RepID=UPI003D69A60C